MKNLDMLCELQVSVAEMGFFRRLPLHTRWLPSRFHRCAETENMRVMMT